MRIFLFIGMLTSILFAMNAEEAAKRLGVENRYDVAIQKAKREKKIVVMVVVKNHCQWCEKLINKTLGNTQVRRYLQNFVTVIVDKNAKYPSDFKENFFPSLFFIDWQTQKSVYENIGYVNTKDFLDNLNTAVNIWETLYKEKN